MSGRDDVLAQLLGRVRAHKVRLGVRPAREHLALEVLREERRAAKSDLLLVLSATQARALMRKLQAGADEVDRLQYQHAKRLQLGQDLDAAVEAVAVALTPEEST